MYYHTVTTAMEISRADVNLRLMSHDDTVQLLLCAAEDQTCKMLDQPKEKKWAFEGYELLQEMWVALSSCFSSSVSHCDSVNRAVQFNQQSGISYCIICSLITFCSSRLLSKKVAHFLKRELFCFALFLV